MNVIKDGELGSFRHLKLPKDFDKTLSNEYYLDIGKVGDLSSLQLYDLRSYKVNEKSYDLIIIF